MKVKGFTRKVVPQTTGMLSRQMMAMVQAVSRCTGNGMKQMASPAPKA